ncbi:MAG: DUF4011 domain-containing protein [Bacillota bacterium]
MGNIDKKIDFWKKKLLDSGKRNRLIHFKETKRSNINILEPSIYTLYNAIVNEEKELSFSYPVEVSIEPDNNIFQTSSDETKKMEIEVVQGDISTNQSITEQQKTLKSLRNRARTALEEQGVNILYLAFGFLTWKETVGSAQVLKSPLILVPVRLSIASMTSPYKLNLHDDEIVFNPTLKHKLENDFNIELPEFDSNVHEIESYIVEIEKFFSQLHWKVDMDVSLSMFSFLKINMYMDLHNHADMLNEHFVVKALCGDVTEVMGIPAGLNHYDHDRSEKPIDVYQTVDADASQQDAVVLADKGVSFVLQGPPGTGKSQTITNIISQSLATGKKVLFVSEKMAALDVVFNRLSSVGLSDFCLSLHNHKVNKKEILNNLSETLSLEKIKTKEESLYLLDTLAKKRALLNEYVEELHIVREPLQKSVYEVNGLLAKLIDIPDVLFRFDNIENVSIEEFRNFEYLLRNLAKTMGELSVDPDSNVWRGSVITHATHEIRQDIEHKAMNIMNAIHTFENKSDFIFETLMFQNTIVFENLTNLKELFELCQGAYAIPKEWLEKEYRDSIVALVDEFADKNKTYDTAMEYIENRNQLELLEIDFSGKKKKVSSILENLKNCLTGEGYDSISQIFNCRQNVKSDIYSGETVIEPILRISDEITEKLGMSSGKTLKELVDITESLCALNQPLLVTQLWFHDIKGNGIESTLLDLNSKIRELTMKKEECISIEQSLDFSPLVSYFKTMSQTINPMELVQLNLSAIQDIIHNGLGEFIYLKNQMYKLSQIEDRLPKANIETVNQILHFTKQCETLMCPADEWFKEGGVESAEKFSALLELKINTYNTLLAEVLEEYTPSILSIDSKAILGGFDNKYTLFYKLLMSAYRKDKVMIRSHEKMINNQFSDEKFKTTSQTTTAIELAQSKLATIRNMIKNGLEELLYLKNQVYKFSQIDNLFLQYNIENLNKIVRFINQCEMFTSATDEWFREGGLESVETFLALLESKLNIYNALSREVLEEYDSSVLLIDSRAMLSRFESKYTSFYKILLPDYRKDKATIDSFRKISGNKISDSEIVFLLKKLIEILELEEFLSYSNLDAKRYLGELFDGKNTQVHTVSQNIKIFKYIQSMVKNQFSDTLKNILMKHETFESYGISVEGITGRISSEKFELFLKVLFGHSAEIVDFGEMNGVANQFLEYCNLSECVTQVVDKVEIESTNNADCFGEFHTGVITNAEKTAREIVSLLKKIEEIAELEKFLGQSNVDAKRYLGGLFEGENTQIDVINKSITTFKYIQNTLENQFSEELKNILMKNETFESYGVSTEEITKKVSSEKLELFMRVFFGESSETIEFEKIDERINQFLEYCNLAESVTKLTDKMEMNSKQYSSCFGELYTGEDTDVEQIKAMIERFQKAMNCFVDTPTKEVEQLILSGENVGAFETQIMFLKDDIDCESLKNVSALFSADDYATLDIADIRQRSQEVAVLVQALENEIGCFTNEAEDILLYQTYEDCISNLELIDRMKSEFDHNHSRLAEDLGSYFEGIQTKWEELKKTLDWLEQFSKHIDTTDLNVQFINNVISLAHKKDFEDLLSNIDEFIGDCGEDFEWFNALFEATYQVIDLPYNVVTAKLNRCIENLHGLEEWIDFKNTQIQCNKSGLADVVAVLLEERIPHTYVIDSFKKRFYKLWQDAIANASPAISQFRRKTQDEIIEAFQKYDLEQMKIAEFRIRELLLSELPELDDSTAPYGDVAILKRELLKKRKIMPIRKLFAKIPSLLLTLKPCLMMSPLSVSLFLNSEVYDFDLVIFDEASQVCTENAIGAIMRAKQVVIAGDPKQLPPTNFFATTTTKDSGYDSDESEEDEDEDDGDFESILDEMLITFPERTLKWHYRSKNEDLITFSNIKIYNNSLMTFPATIESSSGHGVEYVYVEDGIYDRGGKKHNLMEAKKIAELVFEHFKLSNHRSIGVITFSSSQQQAVEDAITKLRLENPIFEPYFNEDRKDAFFVKNIENVQGDERDVIILGIGYGKDASGVMYMNFGPLSRAGGYRRLNVAITRAKYNLKLVGSIRPTDIRLGNTSSDGVKMLRSYIEFAISGREVLRNEILHTQVVDLDSPFEEAVYDFLVAKGYRVSTQVGCSGYRIDMAVHHPTLDGRFVIGIECDGAMYHSSRTARERDRLRQTILEDMGWTFHRIWSTDWIKDSTKEGKLLVDAIERAIDNYVDVIDEKLEQSTEIADQTNSKLQHEEYAYTIEMTDGDSSAKMRFAPYIEADIQTVLSSQNNEIENICDALTLVIAIEYPIHYDLLCKRVASITGNQKATVKVREKVDFALRVLGDVFVVKDTFYYPKDYVDVVAKMHVEGQVQRPIHYISHEEIGVAMMNVVSASFGISKDDLFRVLAKEFGFQRVGTNITNTFDVVFQELLTIQKISFLENRVMMG